MSQITTAESPQVSVPRASIGKLRPILNRAALWSAVFIVASTALVLGLILRRYAWDQTEPIRYIVDINNAFRQGSAAIKIGFIDRYDERTSQQDHPGILDLDYAPGRLAVATLWVKWVRTQPEWLGKNPAQAELFRGNFYPRIRAMQSAAQAQGKADWHITYRLCKPMLMVNLTGEILSAVAMFFLVRRYTSGLPPDYHPVRGVVLGLVSALLFWFNPALIWNAHCWPQWDSWVLPFFLWALLLASLDWWFCAGAIIAAGSMFKGQILFGAPLFLLWPLFQGRLPAMSRWIVGLLSSAAAITAVWLVRTPGTNPTGDEFIPGSVNPHAIEWVVYLTLIFATMVSVIWAPRRSYFRLPLGVVVAAVITWIIAAHTTHAFSIVGFIGLAAVGWWVDDQCAQWSWKARLPIAWLAAGLLIYPVYVLAGAWLGIVLVAAGCMGVLLAVAPRRAIPFAAAGWIATALLLCMPIFNTSRGWLDLGFLYGTHHFEDMARGEPNNLPELLQRQWNWDDLMEPAVTLPKGPTSDGIAHFMADVDPGVDLSRVQQADGSVGLPLKYLLVCVWAVCVILCSIGAAIHDRHRSPRFLIAIATPWIMFFAVMVQMHQRYLLWGASLSAAAAVVSPGFAVLHLFLSIVAMSQEMHSMLSESVYRGNSVYAFIENTHPGIAWAVLLTAAIFLYSSLKRDRRWKKPVTIQAAAPVPILVTPPPQFPEQIPPATVEMVPT